MVVILQIKQSSFIICLVFLFQDAFWCLVSILERPKYLAGYFSDSLDK